MDSPSPWRAGSSISPPVIRGLPSQWEAEAKGIVILRAGAPPLPQSVLRHGRTWRMEVMHVSHTAAC